MRVTKNLKFATFSWDSERKIFTVEDESGSSIKLNKIYGFALMRFIIRIAQKNFLKDPTLENLTTESEDLDLIEDYEDPRQEHFDFSE